MDMVALTVAFLSCAENWGSGAMNVMFFAQ
jgi:hypothetical protein